MRYKGLLILIAAIVLSVFVYQNTNDYGIIGLLLLFVLVLGTSIYGMLKPKSEEKYLYRHWLVIFSSTSVFLLIFSRIILMKYWIGFWQLSDYLFFTSVLLLLAFVILLIYSAYKNKGINFYNSSDAVLLIIPLILFFLLELFHFKNSVSRESIDRIEGLRGFANISVENIIKQDRDSSFMETYEIVERIEIQLIEKSGGITMEGILANGNNSRLPNKIITSSGLFQQLENRIEKLSSSIENEEIQGKLDRLYKYILKENLNNNSVTEMLYRLSLFRLHLKSIELEQYAAQHCI